MFRIAASLSYLVERWIGVIKILIGVARANFLSLTLVCIALAAVTSWRIGASISTGLLVLVTIIGLCAHISVNAFNEYFDFKSGLDFLTNKTPFSGGSGTLVANPGASQLVLQLAVSTLSIVAGGGIYLIYQLGWQLLLIGVPGILLIYGYTRYVNRWPLLCLMAPGFGFGVLMTLGAFWVFADQVTASAWVVSIIVTLLVSDLLLLNQFPDVEADRQVGRRHLPIVIGRRHSSGVYALLLLLSYSILVLSVSTSLLPWQSLLVLLTLLLTPKLLGGIFRFADKPARLGPYLGLNVLFCHLYLLLLLVGLLWAGPVPI
jgi:1,4-dihydroxy-2-naphthoate polyprenyltransferase